MIFQKSLRSRFSGKYLAVGRTGRLEESESQQVTRRPKRCCLLPTYLPTFGLANGDSAEVLTWSLFTCQMPVFLLDKLSMAGIGSMATWVATVPSSAMKPISLKLAYQIACGHHVLSLHGRSGRYPWHHNEAGTRSSGSPLMPLRKPVELRLGVLSSSESLSSQVSPPPRPPHDGLRAKCPHLGAPRHSCNSVMCI